MHTRKTIARNVDRNTRPLRNVLDVEIPQFWHSKWCSGFSLLRFSPAHKDMLKSMPTR